VAVGEASCSFCWFEFGGVALFEVVAFIVAAVDFLDLLDGTLLKLLCFLEVALGDTWMRLAQLCVAFNHLEEVGLGIVLTLPHILYKALAAKTERVAEVLPLLDVLLLNFMLRSEELVPFLVWRSKFKNGVSLLVLVQVVVNRSK